MRIIILALCIWTCKAAPSSDCNPPEIEGGFVVPYKKIYKKDEKVQYACNKGLELQDDKWWGDITCNLGKWTPEPKKCIQPTCSTPQVPNAQEVTQLFTWYAPGARVEFKCNKGFDFKKGRFAECKAGQWVLPECERNPNSCDPPAPVANTVVQSQFQDAYDEGAQIEYRCERGYQLKGDKIRTCLKSTWSRAPTCSKDSSSPVKPPVVPSSGKTRVSECGPHPEITDGDVTEKADGLALIAQCSRFYKLEGPKEVYCNNNEWTERPICKPPCSLDLNLHYYKERFLEDGKTIKDWCYNHRENVQITCTNGQAFYRGCGRYDL